MMQAIEITNYRRKVRTLKFEELNVSPPVLKKLHNAHHTEATPLQQTIISNIREKQDLFIHAEAGEDKIIAFAVAALETLNMEEQEEEGSRVLILTVDQDMVTQLTKQLSIIDSEAGASCAMVGGKGDKDEQAETLSAKPAIVMASPDRLQEILHENRHIFRDVKLLILDEPGNMDDEIHQTLKKIKRRVLSDYTTLICASALDEKIKKTVKLFGSTLNPTGFTNGTADVTSQKPPVISGHLSQGYIKVPDRMKITTLLAHIEQTPSDKCVIFTASKRGTDRLYRVLKKRKLNATSLHGKLSDEKRAQRFANFVENNIPYLLVSDISAAELTVKDITQVINYDVPNSSDEYRFRAALLGSDKDARIVSLVSKQDRSDISELENELGKTPTEIPLPDKVKEKLKQRKNKRSNGQKKNRGGKQKRGSRNKKQRNEMQLPQPSYDKLSGGRSGNYDEQKNGFVKFFKKLFSS